MNGKEAAFSFCSSVFFDLILAIFSPQVMFWFILRGHACERGGGSSSHANFEEDGTN